MLRRFLLVFLLSTVGGAWLPVAVTAQELSLPEELGPRGLPTGMEDPAPSTEVVPLPDITRTFPAEPIPSSLSPLAAPPAFPSTTATADPPSPLPDVSVFPPVPETIVERYPDGTVKVERQVIQNSQGDYVNHGSYIHYDQAGRVLRTGHFRAGRLDGRWVQYFLSGERSLFGGPYEKHFKGPFVSEATFRDAKLHGHWIIRSASGTKVIDWAFVDGVRQGTSSWYYPGGELRREVSYQGGEPDGQMREWSPTGELTARYRYAAGRQIVPEVGWHSPKQKSYEGSYLVVSSPAPAEYDWWNGTVSQAPKASSPQRLKQGRWTTWYPNGQPQAAGDYEFGQPAGRFTWWYASGQKQAEGEIRNGSRQGKWITWHSNGQKESEGTYRDGALAGRWSRWREDGTLIRVLDVENAEAQTPRLEQAERTGTLRSQ